jgi:hypothetical protein
MHAMRTSRDCKSLSSLFDAFGASIKTDSFNYDRPQPFLSFGKLIITFINVKSSPDNYSCLL